MGLQQFYDVILQGPIEKGYGQQEACASQAGEVYRMQQADGRVTPSQDVRTQGGNSPLIAHPPTGTAVTGPRRGVAPGKDKQVGAELYSFDHSLSGTICHAMLF